MDLCAETQFQWQVHDLGRGFTRRFGNKNCQRGWWARAKPWKVWEIYQIWALKALPIKLINIKVKVKSK